MCLRSTCYSLQQPSYIGAIELTLHSAKSKSIAKQYEQYNAIEIVDETIQKAIRGNGF